MNNDDLYNCCTGGKEPDWAQFSTLSLGFSKIKTMDDDYDGETWTVEAKSYDETQFVAVYGMYKDSFECAPITDIHDCSKVSSILAELLKRSGLPLV